MAEFKVAMKNPDETYDYATIEADELDMEPDPIIFKGAIPRYYVLKTELGDVVARFNEKDVAGVFRGEVQVNLQVNLRPTSDGGLLSP